MAFTFIKAQKGKIGSSLVEEDKLQAALDLIAISRDKGVNLLLPTDAIIADKFSNDANTKECMIAEIPDGWSGLDIGPRSIHLFQDVILKSKTILWNGPMGVFEMDKFSKGTIAIAESLAEVTKSGAFTLVGGGDSVAAVNQFGFADKVSYVSTGGGAMLEALEGIDLPGIAAIKKK